MALADDSESGAAGLLAAIVQSADDAILSKGLDGMILTWNASAQRLYGFPADEAIGSHISLIVPEELRHEVDILIAEVASGRRVEHHETVRVRRDGSRVEVSISLSPVRDGEGRVVGASVIARDITARRLAEAQAALLSRVIEASPDALITVESGTITSWNRGAEALFGYRRGDAEGRSLSLIVPAGSDADVAELASRAAASEPVSPFETAWQRRDGSLVPVAISATAVESTFLGSTRRTLALVARDITEQRHYAEQLRLQAFHDSLTGMPNRSLMLDRLEHAIRRAGRGTTRLLVAFIDLDHFKAVNDAGGHPAGDKLLIAVAQRLQTSVRAADTVARFGGDEFVALCEYGHDEDSSVIAARLQGAFTEPFLLEGRPEWITASIGVSFGDGESDSERLLHEADTAMYQAKRRGRNQMCIYDRSENAPTEGLLRLSADLHRALDEDEFRLHYQPILDLRDGRIMGAEALLRWVHPQKGLTGAGQFIPAAEELGLIVALGEWVLAAVAADTAGWSVDPGFALHVNVSSRQLASPGLVGLAGRAARGLPEGMHLVVEVTESAMVAQGSETLHRFREHGVSLAVDDFGTGYSALSYLRQFPVDVIKIDRSFVEDLPDERNIALVRAVVALAYGLGIEVTAEGIETELQRITLVQLGCHSGQGFLYSPAVAPSAFEELLSGSPPGA